MHSHDAISIRPANERDASILRELRLEGLTLHPTAFSADLETNASQDLGFWVDRAQETDDKVIFLLLENDAPLGMIGIRKGEVPKTRHAATIWGVFIKPHARGRQLAQRLLKQAIAWAREHDVVLVKLAVVASNAAALRSYEQAGFSTYGVEPSAICWDGVYYDEFLMALRLR